MIYDHHLSLVAALAHRVWRLLAGLWLLCPDGDCQDDPVGGR